MKNFLFATLLLITSASTAFADPIKVNSSALYNFTSDFRNASNVNWVIEKEYSRAAFTFNSRKMEAFYNTRGEMIAHSKSITLDELPVNAKRTFAKKFEGYTVKEAILLEGLDENAYYISAENEKEMVILKVNENQQVSVYKKTKK
jgi:hypothetical protein